MPKENLKARVGKNCLFEPSFKHRSNYVNSTTYEGIVTVDDSVANSDTFKIIMTNRSNRHVKVHKHQTMGMLKNCEEDQICTIHRIVTFEQTYQKGKEVKSDLKPVEKQLYCIPARNKKTGLIEVNTPMKEEVLSPVTRMNEIGPQQDFVEYKKPELQDAHIDRQIRPDLKKLLKDNDDAFATDVRQIGTTALIKMEIDTGDHPPIAKKPYTLACKHHDWVKEEIDKLLEAGVISKSHSSW